MAHDTLLSLGLTDKWDFNLNHKVHLVTKTTDHSPETLTLALHGNWFPMVDLKLEIGIVKALLDLPVVEY